MLSQTIEKLAKDEVAAELLSSTRTTVQEAQTLCEAALAALTTEGRVNWELENAKRERLISGYGPITREQAIELLETSAGESFKAAVLLQDISREVELLADNVCNLAAIAQTLPTGIQAGSLQPTWERIVDGVRRRFEQVRAALIDTKEEEAARAAREPDPIPDRCFGIIGDLVGNREKALSPGGAVVLAFSVRFLERIGSHLRRLLELVSAA